MILWLADHFTEDLLGGAELTSAALMAASPEPVLRLRLRDLGRADVERHHGATWVIENMHTALGAPTSAEALEAVIATRRFVRLEYDYNWCRARSPFCHQVLLGGECDCLVDRATPLARLYRLMHARAHHVFYMSARQLAIHRAYLGSLMTPKASVLGSCFTGASLDRIRALGAEMSGREWLVVSRWSEQHDFFKGARNALTLARDLGLPFKTAGGLAYDEFLREMATSTGLIYLPNDLDPAPRTVIEAALMGRRLILNDNVLHKDEPWFRRAPAAEVAAYLRTRPAVFWQTTLS